MLRERIIGIKVFGRAPDYDSGNDPIVRARAAEVRKRLAQHYMHSEGASEAFRIEIPPGSYRALFTGIGKSETSEGPCEAAPDAGLPEGSTGQVSEQHDSFENGARGADVDSPPGKLEQRGVRSITTNSETPSSKMGPAGFSGSGDDVVGFCCWLLCDNSSNCRAAGYAGVARTSCCFRRSCRSFLGSFPQARSLSHHRIRRRDVSDRWFRRSLPISAWGL